MSSYKTEIAVHSGQVRVTLEVVSPVGHGNGTEYEVVMRALDWLSGEVTRLVAERRMPRLEKLGKVDNDSAWLMTPCPKCGAAPGERCSERDYKCTTGDFGPEWHEERRPRGEKVKP